MMTLRNIPRMDVVVGLVFLITCVSGCVASTQGRAEVPEQAIAWPSRVDNLLDVGTNGDFLWSQSSKPPAFQVWQWDGSTVIQRQVLPKTKDTYSVSILPHDRWISTAGRHFCVGDLKSKKEIFRWPVPQGLDVVISQTSRNGKHCAATAVESGAWNRNETKVGIVVPEDKAFKWAAALSPDYGSNVGGRPLAPKAIPSDDGKYIGVAGWDNGIAMIDIVNEKVLWTASSNHMPGARKPKEKNNVPWRGVPLDAVRVDDLAFTPDGTTVYVCGAIASDTTGAVGHIWCMNVETGQVVSQWGIDDTNSDEYTRTISVISVSPDGQFVAAGSASTGMVFLYSTKDGKRRILNHRHPGTIGFVSFSPDSRRLAAYCAREIDIWELRLLGSERR